MRKQSCEAHYWKLAQRLAAETQYLASRRCRAKQAAAPPQPSAQEKLQKAKLKAAAENSIQSSKPVEALSERKLKPTWKLKAEI